MHLHLGRAGVRALLLAVLAWLVAGSVSSVVELGPQHQVRSCNPKLGFHTRLTDEVEEWKVKRSLEMVREVGASWVVEYFPWAYYEPRKGQLNFAHADMVVNHAVRQGLAVVARLDGVPAWARPKDVTSSYLDRSGYSDYADFVYAFVRHFRGRIHHYIIWNEPNLGFEWGDRPVDPEGYVELLRLAYSKAKEADPGCLILAAGLAPTLAPRGDPQAMNDLEFLERMYEAGARDYFDMLALHAYGWASPSDEPPASDRINFRRVELYRQVMARYGDEGKKAVITEGGWNDHPSWTEAVRPDQRIAYTLHAYQMALESWEWCEAVALWCFRLPYPSHTFEDDYTFVDPDFSPKPIYLELERYARGCEVGVQERDTLCKRRTMRTYVASLRI